MKLLLPAEKVYQALGGIKNFFYDRHWLTALKLNVPVLSVGNLSFGGTGKTPCIVFLAEELVKDHKVVIVSKSYRASLSAPARVRPEMLNAAQKFGDEACILQRSLPRCEVWSGPVKSETARASLTGNPDLILLDDGFSHRQLKRNFDLVLIDAVTGLESYLREPAGSLKRAHAVLLTKTNLVSVARAEELRKYLSSSFPHLRGKIYCAETKTELPLSPGAPLFVFCGLAQPKNFLLDLSHQGYQIVHQVLFSDHHAYTERDEMALWEKYHELRTQHNNLSLVTTEKDLIKIKKQNLRQNILVPKYSMTMSEQQKEELFETIRLHL